MPLSYFGTSTDMHDITERMIGRPPPKGVSQTQVEAALIVQGKRLYGYAREWKELPAEIQERPVTVKELSI